MISHYTKLILAFLPSGEDDGGRSKWSNDNNPARLLSIMGVCAVALRPCLLCFPDFLTISTKNKECFQYNQFDENH